MRIDNITPTADQLTSLYEQGLIYNLRNLPKGEHRVYVHPRLVLRNKHAKDAKDYPFFLHATQSAFFSGHDLSLLDAIEQALYQHPSLMYYTLGKRHYRYNDLLSSALQTKQVCVI